MRGRACVACASIKIKCQLGSDTSLQPPCKRCVRLNKECMLSIPKRQKDRVAELEAQVASLTRLLQANGIQDPVTAAEQLDEIENAPSTQTPSQPPSNQIAKKRRIEAVPDALEVADLAFSKTPVILKQAGVQAWWFDHLVPRNLQQAAVDRYLNELVPSFPLVPISGDCSLDGLQRDRPTLLQAMIYAGGSGLLSLDIQEAVTQTLLDELSNVALGFGKKTLELLQAIQIVCLWYRTPKYHRHIAVYQLIQLMPGLAADIGLGSPLLADIRAEKSNHEDKLESIDCWRTGLLTYVLSAAMAMFSRNQNTIEWNEAYQQCLIFLGSSPTSLATDRWLSSFFKAERLCEQIGEIMELSDPSVCRDVCQPDMKIKLQTCRNHILNWKVSIAQPLKTPLIVFWENLATVYMHEPVLHTLTNKQSFCAPYVAERISLTDFPAPVVTQDHITAVYEMVTALHAMIDTFTTFDVTMLAAMSGLLVCSRAAYAIYMLGKLYVATTIPGNTLGSVLDSSLLRVEEYTEKLCESAANAKTFDAWFGPARILGAAERMREWLRSCRATICADRSGLLNDSVGVAWQEPASAFSSELGPPIATDSLSSGLKGIEWESLVFSDSAADFGLDILFTEPLPLDNFLNLWPTDGDGGILK